MPTLARWTTRLALALSLALVGELALPSFADAAPAVSCKRKKGKKAKKKKARRARRAEAATPKAKKPRKVTYKTVLRMWKKKKGEDAIVAAATEAGYVPSDKDVRILKKRKLPASLIAALQGAPEAPVAAATPTPATRKVDLDKITRPEDIDFDDVPPPKGMPAWVKKQQEARAAEAEKKKKLDTSLRPSAPFEEKARTAAGGDGEARRVVVAGN